MMHLLQIIAEPLLYVWLFIGPFAGAVYGYKRGYADAWKRIQSLRDIA